MAGPLPRLTKLTWSHQANLVTEATGFEPAISAVTGQRFKPAKLRLVTYRLNSL